MRQSLVLINPNAASGRALTLWRRIAPHIEAQLGVAQVVVTQQPEAVAHHIDAALQNGTTHVFAVGGDGTNHSLINALAEKRAQRPDDALPTSGIVPVGTGCDFARTLHIPRKPQALAAWLAQARSTPIDIGLLRYRTPDGAARRRYFLNVASGGLGGEVVARVNRTPRRRAWTFLKATVAALFNYAPLPMRVEVDGALWYEGESYIVAVANGTTFGRGMKVAPHARVHDGLLDIVLVEGMSRFAALQALPSLYRGAHLKHPRVRWRRGREVTIVSESALDVELDGEYVKGTALHFSLCPSFLHMLTRG